MSLSVDRLVFLSYHKTYDINESNAISGYADTVSPFSDGDFSGRFVGHGRRHTLRHISLNGDVDITLNGKAWINCTAYIVKIYCGKYIMKF